MAAEIPQNLAAAQRANSSMIHVLADWSQIAPTRPRHPLDGNDPAYRLSDLDALVRLAPRYNQSLLVTISGTPRWANGGQTANHPPRNLNDLTRFAHMLAARYNGRHAGFGAVRRWSVWNEPNLGRFLTPQYRGEEIVSAAAYARLYMAAYRGIKAGSPDAMVAAGETSNRGRNHPTGSPGHDSVAPATFARLVAAASPKLPLAAWAEHPYPTVYRFGPLQKVRYPNLSLTNLARFGADLQSWFHRRVPIWVTDWAVQTRPEYRLGVSYAQQARDATLALKLARENPYVEMFLWFVFRDSSGQTWFSGLEKRSGARKPAYAAFARAAKPVDGLTQTVRPGRPFTVTVDVPFLAYGESPGQQVGITYRVLQGPRAVVALGQPRARIRADQTVTFKVNFKPQRGLAYTLKRRRQRP